MVNNLNNIPDELLAAYLDGNTTPEENKLIEDAIKTDENMMEVVDISTEILDIEDISEIDEFDDLFDNLM